MKKRALALMLAGTLMLCLAACGAKDAAAPDAEESAPAETKTAAPDGPVELTVFAAASMNETLDKVIEIYEKTNTNVKITATYDSSGTLKTQIEEGAYCDIFISAAQKQINQLDASKDAESNPDALDFVLQGTRTNLLENKVVLAVPEGNPAGIMSFSDIATDKLKLLCIGNEDVPVGSYSLEILNYLKLSVTDMETDGLITYGSNVKEVTTAITEGTVDAGIIYATDAFSAGLTVVDQATTDMCKRVVYPAAIINASKNVEAAQAFLDFLKTDEAMAVFKAVGFTAA